jgi:hypothetical protein
MAPSWMPQNIQKRVFKYVLNKLAVFSNLDLENLDVSLGRTSNLSVNDVELDTEKLSIPGVYVRQGGIKKLNVQLGVVSGVKLEGSDIEATVAISQYPPNEDDQDLSALLSKTTNDIAESILVKEAKDGLLEENEIEEDSDNGYGMGEFSTLVSRLVDAAMSQLIVELRKVVIHVVASESVKMDLLIDEILFSTGDDNQRHATVNGIRLVLIEHEYAGQQDGGYEAESDSSDSDEDESELMQSTVFSREEASTMYMSALSDMAETEPKFVQKPVFECNSVKLSFSGIAAANLKVEISSVLGTVESFPEALIPLVRFANNYLFVTSGADESDEPPMQREEAKYAVDVDTPQSFSLKKLAINSIKLKLGDQTESDTYLVLSDITVTHKDDLLLEVRNVNAIRGEYDILSFGNDEEDPNSDFICKIKRSSTTYLLPNPAVMNVAFEDLVLLGDCVDDLVLLATEFGVASENERCEEGRESTKSISAQTNMFSLKLDTGVNVISVTVLPVSFDRESGLRVGRIKGKINDSEILEIDPGKLCVSDVPETIVRRQDSEEVPVQVLKKLLIDKIALKLSERSLVGILSDIRRLHDHLVDHRATKTSSVLRNVEDDTRKVRISDDATAGPVELAISITSIECVLELEGRMGTFNLDFRNLDANFFQNKVQSTFGTVHASRDFSDIDPAVKYVSLIHTANPLLKVSFGLYVMGKGNTD